MLKTKPNSRHHHRTKSYF